MRWKDLAARWSGDEGVMVARADLPALRVWLVVLKVVVCLVADFRRRAVFVTHGEALVEANGSGVLDNGVWFGGNLAERREITAKAIAIASRP